MLDALGAFLARFVSNFLVDVLLHSVFYPLGWFMLKVLTLGRYPPSAPHNRDLVAAFPIVVLLVGITVAFS